MRAVIAQLHLIRLQLGRMTVYCMHGCKVHDGNAAGHCSLMLRLSDGTVSHINSLRSPNKYNGLIHTVLSMPAAGVAWKTAPVE